MLYNIVSYNMRCFMSIFDPNVFKENRQSNKVVAF